MVAEKKRMEGPPESRGISKQKWLEDRKKKIGKLLDANGLDMTKAYMLDTQEAAEAKYKKWEKDPAPFGWDGMFASLFITSLFHIFVLIPGLISSSMNLLMLPTFYLLLFYAQAWVY